jgi:hypothetical protein
VAEYLTVVGIDGKERQQWRIPVSYSGAAWRRGGGKLEGKWRGGRGLLIGLVGEPFPLRINEGEWGVIGGVGYQ